MKKASKLAALALACALSASIVAGCSGSGSGGDAAGSASDAGSGTPSATADQDVTIPASYFTEAVSADEAVSQLEDAGCTDVTANDDGSYSATMDADSYNKMVSDLHERVLDAIATAQDGTTYPNIASVTYDDGFTAMQVNLNTDTPGLEDTYALAAVGVPAATYQQVAGLPVGCDVSLVLEDGTVQQTRSFPIS